jgi:hypothetical protein
VIVALVSSDKVEQNDSKVVSDVLMLLVPHDLIETWKYDLWLLKQLNQVSK